MATVWMTWKSEGWRILRELVAAFQHEGTVIERWRIKGHRQAEIGDRVFLFKEGANRAGYSEQEESWARRSPIQRDLAIR